MPPSLSRFRVMRRKKERKREREGKGKKKRKKTVARANVYNKHRGCKKE